MAGGRGDRWQAGEIDFPDGYADPDGADWLFQPLTTPTPEAFKEFAEDYYETTVDLDAVRRVYDLRPLNRRTVRALNATTSLKAVAAAAVGIGHPTDAELPDRRPHGD
ncbi:hypothetical protein ACIRPT_23520 [Streptomyces sp. NPDC101227]|uniref:hypothetical protein n=1 Tax=Streptomyces sp. NPDC101227 TaxID=3366136 RepID=UPI00380077D7